MFRLPASLALVGENVSIPPLIHLQGVGFTPGLGPGGAMRWICTARPAGVQKSANTLKRRNVGPAFLRLAKAGVLKEPCANTYSTAAVLQVE